MRVGIAIALALGFSSVSFAEAPRSYADAKAIWLHSRDTAEYRTYAAEFSQFSNHFHLDEKDGCYALASGTVNLILVIGRQKNGNFAMVERCSRTWITQ